MRVIGSRLVVSPVLAAVLLFAAARSAAAIDLTAYFSNDATELTTGVFMHVNSISAGPFSQAQYLMRPFVLDTGGASSGAFVLGSTGSLLEAYLPDGTPVPLPATWNFDAVPPVVLVSALAPGETTLFLWHRPTAPIFARRSGQLAITDIVTVRIGPFPGLAGRTLAAYPWFEFVKAVNQDDRIDSAIDPTRHPERVGLSYRSYVVAHKTPSQWEADPTLVDVSGGFGTHVVSAPDIQANTLTVWAAGLLGDAGQDLGVPYDIVYDFGLDGRLDAGDLIDGLDASGEAGIYVLKDTTQLGPLATAQFEFDNVSLFPTGAFDGGSARSMRSRGRVVYPSPLPPGQLPLVTFSHGNTGIANSYQGYTYLQTLLASHGFITASFDMFPAHVSLGIRWRGWLTNKNTERMIVQTALYPQMGGGVLDGKVDGDQIVTSGHSRGGEGVIIQYNQVSHPEIAGIIPPGGTLTGFDAASFKGIHAIAEVTFINEASGSDPRDVPFLLYFGSSDDDVCGCSGSVLPTIHYNRAEGDKAWVYLYGAGHGYFNSLWACTCVGPNLMTRPDVEAISKGYLLPWVQRVVRGNVPATEYFTRGADRFRPIGAESVPATRRVVTMWRDEPGMGNFTVDDFQSQPSTMTSSSGQPVSFDVSGLIETSFVDTNPSAGYSAGEPDGGFWWETSGVIFNWNGADFRYDQTIAPAERDLRDDTYVSFIACQQSNHPETIGLGGDASISLTLIDADGVSSSINSSAYGSIDTIYSRSGGGWGTAFKTFRVRIADFETNGSGIDLGNVETIRFDVGSANGSSRGRIGIDDIEIVKE